MTTLQQTPWTEPSRRSLMVPALLLSVMSFLCFCGCSGGTTSPKAKSTSRKTGTGLKPKFTKEIGEFNADEGKEQVESKVKYSNPITGPLEAFDPMKQKLAEVTVVQAVERIRAMEGRYPRDYDEFKAKVIDENGLRLPTLGVGKRYEYDVAEHRLIVVIEQPQ